jgi:hypothetical protein
MKNLVKTIVFSFLFTLSCNAQEIDFDNPFNNKILLESTGQPLTKEILMEFWSKNIDNGVQITSIKIIKGINKETSEDYYLIIGNNKENTFKIATEVTIAKTKNTNGIVALDTTVTCKSTCDSGCDPEKWGDNYNCTKCTWSGNTACEKTVTKKF